MFQNRAYGETAPFPTACQSAAAYESAHETFSLLNQFLAGNIYGMINQQENTAGVCNHHLKSLSLNLMKWSTSV